MFPLLFYFSGSKGGKVTNVTVAGCADKPVCPLKHKTNVSFEVDFKVGRYHIIANKGQCSRTM